MRRRKRLILLVSVVAVICVALIRVARITSPVHIAVVLVSRTDFPHATPALVFGVTNETRQKVRIFEGNFIWAGLGGAETVVQPVSAKQVVLGKGEGLQFFLPVPTNTPVQLMIPWVTDEFGSLPATWNLYASRYRLVPYFPGSSIKYAASDSVR